MKKPCAAILRINSYFCGRPRRSLPGGRETCCPPRLIRRLGASACLFALVGFLADSRADTIVSGVVAGETWSSNGSPYVVTGDVMVAQLKIGPGVEVRFETNAVFEVDGILQAEGTADQPIQFTNGSDTTKWKGIFFNESPEGCSLLNCRVEGSAQSGIRIKNTLPAISHCTIANNSSPDNGGGVKAEISTGVLLLDRCTFMGNTASDNGGGLYIAGSARVSGCVVSGNKAGGGDGGGLSLRGDQAAVSNCRIVGNQATWGGGIELWNTLRTQVSISLSNSIVATNSVTSGGAALFVGGNASAEIANCTFVAGNTAAIQSYYGTEQVLLTNSIVYFNNGGGQQIAGPGSLSMAYSDVQGGAASGNGMKSVNPVLNPATLELLTGSPCIDAGNPDPIYNDTCFPPSRGTERNDMGAYGGPGACNWLAGDEPAIATQPVSQSSCLASTITFSVGANGSEPLSYQWFFQGAPITGQTNAQLTLPNLQATNTGAYTVTVSNQFGSVTSEPAQLTVYDACIDLHMYAGLTISGQQGGRYVVSYTSDLSNTNSWVPLATNTLGASDWFYLDMDSPFSPKRFYKANLQP
jgi:parallel beta-helix repeat protein